jgi:hypothetical protein
MIFFFFFCDTILRGNLFVLRGHFLLLFYNTSYFVRFYMISCLIFHGIVYFPWNFIYFTWSFIIFYLHGILFDFTWYFILIYFT